MTEPTIDTTVEVIPEPVAVAAESVSAEMESHHDLSVNAPDTEAPLQYVVLDIETAPFPPEILKARGFRDVPRNYSAKTAKAFIQTDEQYWQQWHDDTAQLDPGRSYVCAAGLYLPGVAARFGWAEHPGEERSMLEAIYRILFGEEVFGQDAAGTDVRLNPDRLVLIGHNLRQFDLPYLSGRDLIANHRRDIHIHALLDTKDAWESRYSTGANSSSLDPIAATLGLPTKPGNGKDFWTWPREKRQEYLQHDLLVTHAVAERLGLVPA